MDVTTSKSLESGFYMPAIKKVLIPITDVSMVAIQLRNEGFDRFWFKPFEKNKKFIELRAWKFKARPRKNPS